jgi:uncharacterized protein YdhG (YjbR/CyaY superfamily)
VAKFTTVDERLANLTPERRGVMDELRRTVREAAPNTTETIAYDMPAYRSADGRFVVSFDAFARHYSLFPASTVVVEQLGDEIAPYVAGKGTIRFPASAPVPLDLVRKVVQVRLEELASSDAE